VHSHFVRDIEVDKGYCGRLGRNNDERGCCIQPQEIKITLSFEFHRMEMERMRRQGSSGMYAASAGETSATRSVMPIGGKYLIINR
jgi:hypothetical protein